MRKEVITHLKLFQMMEFYKFDGAGNDFVIVDIRERDPKMTAESIAHICHRRRGVGADGLMTLGIAPEGYALL